MFIQGNMFGLLMFVTCGLVAIAGGFILKLPEIVTMIGIGSALMLMDMDWRHRRHHHQHYQPPTTILIALLFSVIPTN